MVSSAASGPSSSQLDAPSRAALSASHLQSLPVDVVARLTADASRMRVPAGSTIHREGDTAAHLEIVVSGLIRVYVQGADGRTMTVRYCRPGALIGVLSLFASPFALPATIQTVTDAELLILQASLVRHAAERDVRVARALLDELSERVMAFIAEIPGGAFASVRQRVARHLLDLASESQDGGALLVRSASRTSPMPSARSGRSLSGRCGSCVRPASCAPGAGRSSCSTPSGWPVRRTTSGAGTNVPLGRSRGR